MHTLFLVTALLAAHPPEWTLPGSQSGQRRLLEANPNKGNEDEGKTLRVIIEFGGGIALGMGGALFGNLALTDASSSGQGVIPMAFLVLGSGVGVTLAGWAMDGRGKLGPALLGSIVGFAIPMLMGMAMLAGQDCRPEALSSCSGLMPIVIGVIALPSLGATIGYELSAPTPWLSLEHAPRASPASPRIVPVLAPARQGVGLTLGFAGRL